MTISGSIFCFGFGLGFGLDGPAEAEVEGASTETCALFARFARGGAVADC